MTMFTSERRFSDQMNRSLRLPFMLFIYIVVLLGCEFSASPAIPTAAPVAISTTPASTPSAPVVIPTSTSTPTSAPSATPLPSATPPNVIFNLVWSNDGNRIAASTPNGIVLFDRATLARIRTIDEGEYTESAAFSPDGTRVACTCDEGLIKIWDVQTGQLLKSLKDDESFFTSVAINPNSTQLVGGTRNGRLKVWDASGERLLFTVDGLGIEVSPLAFSPDGRRLLAASSLTGNVRLWEAATGKLIYAFPDYSMGFGIEFSPDGTRIAQSHQPGIVLEVWDVNSAKLLTTIRGIEVIRFAFSADSRTLICLCREGILQWDASTGKPLRTLSSYEREFFSLAVSPDGKLLAVGTIFGTIKLLNLSE